MHPVRGVHQSNLEIAVAMRINLLYPMTMCDDIFEVSQRARVCVVGSESGYAGSHDDTYAAAKAALHSYVERKRLPSPDQQLVAVAPSIIGDCFMTLRRRDTDNLARKAVAHPKKRFLRAIEVARLIHYLLYVDEGYISNVVVRINGGMHVRP